MICVSPEVQADCGIGAVEISTLALLWSLTV